MVAIATVTCRAQDWVSAEREAVIGRRVAIVRAGVREGAETISADEPYRRFRNNSRRVRSRENVLRARRAEFHLRRDDF